MKGKVSNSWSSRLISLRRAASRASCAQPLASVIQASSPSRAGALRSASRALRACLVLASVLGMTDGRVLLVSSWLSRSARLALTATRLAFSCNNSRSISSNGESRVTVSLTSGGTLACSSRTARIFLVISGVVSRSRMYSSVVSLLLRAVSILASALLIISLMLARVSSSRLVEDSTSLSRAFSVSAVIPPEEGSATSADAGVSADHAFSTGNSSRQADNSQNSIA